MSFLFLIFNLESNLFRRMGLFQLLCIMFICLFQIFICACQHQLDTVQLVDLTCTGVIVNRNHVGHGVLLAQLLDDTLANNMVRQTTEGLCADDIRHTAVNQFNHFRCQEPTLARLVAEGNNLFRLLAKASDTIR